MTEKKRTSEAALAGLRRPLRLTRFGMVAERATRAFWPLWTLCLTVLAALMMGLQDVLPLEAIWSVAILSLAAALWFLVRGVARFRWPSRIEAEDRLDLTMPGRPIAALTDTQVIGAQDAASMAVWRTHVARMAERVAGARPVHPDLRLATRDPYALRYVAVMAFIIAVLFGSVWRVATVAEIAAGHGGAAAGGPSWEGWVEPPVYTGKPSLYLNDIDQADLAVPRGSRVTLRLYGEVGALTVAETVSGRTEDLASVADASQSFLIEQDGTLGIDGRGGRSWTISVIPDAAPIIRLDGEVERSASGEMRQPFAAEDDYGVVAGRAGMVLDLDAVDRRYGLAPNPQTRDAITLDLPMTITGDRSAFSETLIDDLSQHPWAGLPVTLTLEAEDAAGQTGQSEPETIILPGRRFFDPLARAIIEQRRDLLWSRDNGTRVAQVLRAVTYKPEGFVKSETTYLMLRVAIRRLEAGVAYGFLPETQEEIAQALWDIAVLLEDGKLSDALERMRQAQDRLSEAMRQGANDEEIAELMQELREATEEYMRQLAQQAQENGDTQQADNQNMQTVTQDQLQEMMDRIQELMEQGRMAEAQELLDRLRQMMENMQVTQGQGGDGQQSPGEQAMEDLQDTLRKQQGLSDQAFRDLQERFNPGAQAGQSDQNSGQSGGQGKGESHDGQGGTGEGEGEGENQQSLADRQQALRNELGRQQSILPSDGSPEGRAAQDALGRAGRAMDGAEDALRSDDLAGALDDQAEAMEALREGLRNLGEALAQQQSSGQQGEATSRATPQGRRDPLGRDAGANGQVGTDESLLQGEDVYRRARELLDEIRRRSSEQERPDVELDYLKRLLDRF